MNYFISFGTHLIDCFTIKINANDNLEAVKRAKKMIKFLRGRSDIKLLVVRIKDKNNKIVKRIMILNNSEEKIPYELNEI